MARRLRGALAHLRPAAPVPAEAALAGETTGTAMTTMALSTCSTGMTMLGLMAVRVQGRAHPATQTQDLKVPAIDKAVAS